jgi:predicted dehydrogenase
MNRKNTGRPERPDTINIGIIGAGFARNVHLPAFRSCRGCDVLGLVSRDPDISSKARMEYGLKKTYVSWRKMIEDPDIDAVSIAVPPSEQPQIAMEAFARRKAVLCEKPLSSDLRSAEELLESSISAGTPNMVDFEFPEIELWKKARHLVRNGEIGPLRHITVNWNVETFANKTGLKSWKTDIDKGGGALNTFVSHVFYYLEWFGGPLKGLQARIHKIPGDSRSGDSLNMISAEFTSGVPCSIVVSTHSFMGKGHQVTFFGDEGTLVLDNPTRDYISGFRMLITKRGTDDFTPVSSDDDTHNISTDGRIGAVSGIVHRFIEWISGSSPCKPDLADGFRVQTLIEACRLSSCSGKWIDDLNKKQKRR